MEDVKTRVAQMDEQFTAGPEAPSLPSLEFEDLECRRGTDGIHCQITFTPIGNLALSEVDFTLSVLAGSEGKISDISPGVPMSLMVQTTVSPSGDSATVRYTVAGSAKPAISVELTGPARLRIQGTPGVEPFELDAK